MRKVLAAALLAALCACADAPVVYTPTRLPAQLPTARLPKLLLEDVVDQTGGGEFFSGGAPWPRSAMTSAIISWANPVQDAFNVELRRLGWPTTESRTSAGARMRVTVEHARIDMDMNGWVPHQATKIVIGIALEDSDGRPVWTAELKGAGHGTGGGPDGLIMAFNDAIPRLGPLLADERPWERLPKNDNVDVANVPPSPAPSEAPAPSDIDTLPPAGALHPRTYAVVVGVEHYRAKLPNADFAASDARLAAEYFKRVLGVPEANVALLTDDQATKGDFEKYFERWLPNQVQTGDTVYVYYSGHGAPNPAKGDSYMVPYDGDPTYIDSTGFAVQRLLADLSRLPAKQVYVAVDSCFSGAGGRSVIAQGARPLVNVVPSQVPSNVTVISASSGDQISNSYREKGHGLFTYFLLKGLSENQGDLRAAFDYLKPEVSRLAKTEYNSAQEPQWREGR